MAFVLFNLAAVAALVGIDQLIKLWAVQALQLHTPPATSASAAGSTLLPSAATPHTRPCAHAAPALWKHKRSA